MSEPLTISEIQALRAETSGCREDAIFLNNAGASLQPRPVIARVVEHLRLEEQIGGYEAADQTADARNAVYSTIARLVGADKDEIAILESSSRAWDMAFYAIPFKQGDRIVTAQNEYSSNYVALLQIAKRSGAEIVVAPAAPNGEVDLDGLRRILAEGRVKLVALTHIATNNGMVQPAAEVGRLTKEHGALLLLDACQSVGQMHLDVKSLGCDMLAAAGRKFLRGPRGTGFLYMRRELVQQLEPPMIDNHSADWSALNEYTVRSDARRFELFESSAALALGLGKAAEYAMAIGLDRIEARVQQLAALLREGLAKIDGVHVTDTGSIQSGIVIFVHERVPSALLVAKLAEKRMTVRLSPRFATRLDEKLSALDELVRASIHYFNTEDEVERLCSMLADLVEVL